MKRLLFLVTMMLLAMVYVVYSAPTAVFITPSTGGSVSGTYPFAVNVTEYGRAPHWNVSNCTLTFSSVLAGGGVSSGTIYIHNMTHVNQKNSTCNGSINTGLTAYALSDSTDWAVGGTCYNITGGSVSITGITITIDNTVPTCVFDSAFVSKGTYAKDQTWQVTGTNATSGLIRFDANKYTLTETYVNSDVFEFSGYVPEALYSKVTADVSDGTNRTTCSLDLIEISTEKNAIQIAAASKTGAIGQKQTGFDLGDNMWLIVVLIIGAVWWFNKKK